MQKSRFRARHLRAWPEYGIWHLGGLFFGLIEIFAEFLKISGKQNLNL